MPVVVLLFAAFAFVGVPSAKADYTADLAKINDSSNDAQITSELLKWPSTESGLSGLGIDASTGVAAAEESAGVGVLGTAAIVPVAIAGVSSFLVTREVLHLTGGDSFFYRKFSGSDHTVSQPDHLSWRWFPQASFNTCAGTVFSSCSTIPNPAGLYLYGTTDGVQQWSARTPTPNAYTFGQASGATMHAWNGGGGGYFDFAFESATLAGALQLAQAAGQVTVAPATAGDYASPPAGGSSVDLGTRPTTLTPTQLGNAKTQLGDGSAISQAAAAAIAATLPVRIFMPGPNETYLDYTTRLRASGILGTITNVELSPDNEDLTVGANAVSRLQVKLGTDTVPTTLFPATWPFPYPYILPNTPITIYHNPADAPSVPGRDDPANPGHDLPGGGVPPVTPGSCGPTVPSINFDPLTSPPYGTKFPFAIFSWIGSALSPLTHSPLTPVFDVPIHLPLLHSGMANGSIHIDFSPANPYMSVMRLLMTIGLAITAVWLIASSLLGFRGGHPGGGLDDEEMV